MTYFISTSPKALAQMQTPSGEGMMSQYPLGFGQWLQALFYALSQPREIAIVGDPDSADTQALLRITRDGYRPFQVVALESLTSTTCSWRGRSNCQAMRPTGSAALPLSRSCRIEDWWMGVPQPTCVAISPVRLRSPIQMGFVPFWAGRRQDWGRQMSCEEAVLQIAYTTLRRRLTIRVESPNGPGSLHSPTDSVPGCLKPRKAPQQPGQLQRVVRCHQALNDQSDTQPM